MANGNYSLGGRKARSSGAFFEQLIEISCSYYRRFGLADIQKTPEPIRIIKVIDRKKGMFEAVFEKKAQPDFKGVIKGGQMILFEAKRTQASNIAKNRISSEQERNFNTSAKLGAECFVLVSFNEKNFYKVPWNVWERMEAIFKKKSVNKDDLAPYEVEYMNGLINFL